MRAITRRVLLSLALPLAACTSEALSPTLKSQALTGRQFTRADIDFVTYAYQIVRFDNEEGRLAAANGASPAVQAFAAELIGKANTLYPPLRRFIGDAGVAAPNTLNPDLASRLARLRPLRGAAFDRQYLADQINSHEDAIPPFQQAADGTGDPEIRAFAKQALPVVTADLQRARQLARGGR